MVLKIWKKNYSLSFDIRYTDLCSFEQAFAFFNFVNRYGIIPVHVQMGRNGIQCDSNVEITFCKNLLVKLSNMSEIPRAGIYIKEIRFKKRPKRLKKT